MAKLKRKECAKYQEAASRKASTARTTKKFLYKYCRGVMLVKTVHVFRFRGTRVSERGLTVKPIIFLRRNMEQQSYALIEDNEENNVF
jgi:hypothetical protein